MLRCFSTLCCQDYNLRQVISLALSTRMYGVEIRMDKDGTILSGMTIADAEEIRTAFADAGLTVTDVGLSVSPAGYEPQKIEAAKPGIDLASAIGARGVRLFLGKFQKKFSQLPDDDIPGIARTLREMCAYAAEKNVEIWLETHSEFSTGKSLREILDLTGCDNLKVIWDIIHTVEYKESVADTVAYLGSALVHVHVKDGIPADDADSTQYIHTDLGAGAIPIAQVLSALRGVNYRGFISLEWESPWRPEIRELYPDPLHLLFAFNKWIEANDQKAALADVPLPPFYPPAGHPRVMFRKSDIPAIRARMTAPENADALRRYRKALQDDAELFLSSEIKDEMAKMTPEELRSCRSQDRGIGEKNNARYRHINSGMLDNIEIRAFAYAIEGNEAIGRSAAEAMLQYLDNCVSMGYDDVGQLVHTAAEIYDWCYSLFSKEERALLLERTLGFAERLEIGFPPTKQGPLSGHGVESQLFRDLFALGIAAYDEKPEIYDVSAGLLVWEFIPARRFFNAAHMNMQGSHYTIYRAHWEYLCTALLRGMGEANLFGPSQGHLLDWLIHGRRPDGFYLFDGDHSANNYDPMIPYEQKGGRDFALGASLYKNPQYKDEMMRCMPGFLLSDPNRNGTMNTVEYLLLHDPYLEPKPHSELPTTKFFPFPKGGVLVRTGWNMGRDSADVLCEMKINEYWSTNHQHQDAGAFQIYYKGMLATDSGYYQSKIVIFDREKRLTTVGNTGYGGKHDYCYNKATIAHNAMLVYDPDEEGGLVFPAGGQPMMTSVYKSIDAYIGVGQNHIADVLGYHSDKGFTYLSGELSRAYGRKVKNYVRSFVFLDLGREECPAALIVHDDITSADPMFRKFWLCHGINAPQTEGSRSVFSVTERGCNGRLTVDTLLPREDNLSIDSITDPTDFDVFGEKYPAELYPDRRNEGGACRIMVSPKIAAERDRFLHVLQVSDADLPAMPKPTYVEGRGICGTVIYDTAVLFADPEAAEFSLTLPARCARVILCGIRGTWTVNGNICKIRTDESMTELENVREISAAKA